MATEAQILAGLQALGEPRLSPRISLEASGGPSFGNLVLENSHGLRKTIELWPRDLREWNINFVVRWDSKDANSEPLRLFRELMAFWRLRRANSRSFRFKDWTDYKDEGKGRIIQRNGVYRLVKDYKDVITNEVYTLPIFKPVPATIAFTGPGTLNYSTGIVSGATGPATWTGEYDIWCHFTEPKMNVRPTPGGVVNWNGVSLMEDMLDEVALAIAAGGTG